MKRTGFLYFMYFEFRSLKTLTKAEIGVAKVDRIAAEIEERSKELADECLNQKAPGIRLTRYEGKNRNQTCLLSVTDMTFNLQVKLTLNSAG